MKNLYVFLLALVWLLAGSIQVNATTTDKATYSDGLAAAPTFTYTKTDVLLCNGQATGSISITASGGTGNYLYSKDNGATFTDTPQFTNLTAGTYQVVVKDGSNVVSAAQAVTINQPAPLTASVTSVTSTCPGLSTGAISTSAGGGVGPYQYSLNGGDSYQASSLFTSLPANFYPLKVKDANGCVFGNTTYQVTAPTAPTVTPSVTNVSCNGLQDGSIRVTLSGGVNIGQALISINNGATYVNDTQFHLLGVGTYPILVKYANNCVTPVQSVSVTQPAPVSFSTAITSTLNCHDATTGSITVTAAGGSGSYVYSKDNGNTYQDGNLFGELGAGSYRIAVKDANGCTAPVQTVELSQPTAVTYTITQTDVSCFGETDGRISIEASGGTGPYEYFFSAYGPASIRNPNDPRTTSKLADGRGARVAAGEQYDNLAAQTYYITIHDANFCYTSIDVTLDQPSALVAETSVTNAQCNSTSSGSITVIPSGGTAPYQYSRDGGTTFQTNAQFTGLSAGNYAIVVKDAHNCLSESKSVEVSEPTVVTFTANQTNATCFGSSTGSIEVNASGGIDSYQYSRDNGATYQSSNTFTDLAANTYPIVVKDANGCVSAAQSVTVGQPDLLTFTVAKTDVSDCFGNSSGSLSVSASGGTSYYLYSIDNGNRYTDDRFFADLGADTYPVMVKDANGCVTAAQNIVISQPTALTYTLTEVDVSCFGGNDGRITIDAQGGTGPYQYTFSMYGPALISNPSVLRATSQQAGLRGARAAAGQQYNSLAAQTYYLTVRDANGCSINLTSTINQPSAISITTSASPVLCAGGSNGRITVTASGGTGGYQYSKDNGANYQPANQFDNLSAGTYQVVVKDANNCVTAVQSVTVTQPSVLTAAISKTDVTTCFGGTNGSITVTASGGTSGYQYSRDNGATFQASNQFTSLPASTYQIVVKDANNCVTTAQNVTIGQPTLLAFSTTKGDVTGCFGNSTGSISVTTSGGTGPYQYSKDNGATFQASNQFTNLPAGTYQVVVKDANGCVANAQSVILNQPPALSATTTATPVSCYSGTNGSITVQVTGAQRPIAIRLLMDLPIRRVISLQACQRGLIILLYAMPITASWMHQRRRSLNRMRLPLVPTKWM
ncbi:hypothetical protein GO730_01455 [Spirosoma sp. HMF3257]|nr:hypothetical protein [Spirosoma telluris]